MMQEDARDPALTPRPWWQSKTVWTTLVAVLLALPAIIEPILPLLTDDQRRGALALSAMLAAIGSLFARKGGVEAAKEAVAAHEAATGFTGLTQPPPGDGA